MQLTSRPGIAVPGQQMMSHASFAKSVASSAIRVGCLVVFSVLGLNCTIESSVIVRMKRRVLAIDCALSFQTGAVRIWVSDLGAQHAPQIEKNR